MYQAVIVDDEPFIVDGLVNALNWEGYDFEIAYTATNPVNALEYIQTNSVHLLITDISMPELDGLQLIKQAKEINPLLSVIVLSAYDNFEYVRTALRHGAENYLLKPIDSDELSEAVSQIVNRMQQREELSDTYGKTTLTFRSNFIELWVKNSLSYEDMVTKSNLLGINLDADNFTAVIFSSLDNNTANMSLFFDLLLSYLPGLFTVQFYFETPLCLVCILTVLDKDAEVGKLVNQIQTSAYLSKISVFASIGSCVDKYNEVAESYQQAHSLLFLKHAGFSCFYYDELKPMAARIAALQFSGQTDDFSKTTKFIENIFTNKLTTQSAYHLTIGIVSELIGLMEKTSEDVCTKFPDILNALKSFPASLETIDTYRQYCLTFVEYYYSVNENIQNSMYPCVEAVIKAIHEFSDKDISLKTLSQKLNVSPSYLGTVFKQQTGSYFNDYLTEARLNYAAKLIETSDMKMKDIVDKVGFSRQTYFNRSFKRYFNISPVAYRRQKKLQ
jgi:Response regulator containing CheY-like receiver domain and AraC-type DNA-binding domain